jgi:hypothetical protein
MAWNLLILSLLTAAGPTVEAPTLDGETLTGSLIRLDAEGATIQTADGPVTLSIDRLAAILPEAGPPKQQPTSDLRVELTDGSMLAALEYTVADAEAHIVLPDGKELRVPTRHVASVRFQSQSETMAAEWSRIRESAGEGDLLVIRKNDSVDYLEGLLHEVTETVVQFELEGEIVPVKRTKIHGLSYYRRAKSELPEPRSELTGRDGSTWPARSVSVAAEMFHWTTPLGLEFDAPATAVARIDFSRGKIVYLSDLEPESVEWAPFFGAGKGLSSVSEFFAPRRDQGFDSGPLLLEGKSYPKGLAIHSRTRLVYRLPGPFGRFRATAGIDDRVRPNGNVRLVVLGDDRMLLETTLAGSGPPEAIDLDLRGVRRLTILVDFGADLDVADHLNLCEARVIK